MKKTLWLALLLLTTATMATSKSTIEPCSNSDTCNALVGYTLYTELKVSEVASLFNADPISILTANSIDISLPDVENRILPGGLFLRVPVSCACSDGIRRSVATKYRARPSDTLASIADSVYAGLVSADQLRDANGLDDGELDVGQSLTVPLPCTCFNGTDNSLPAVYLSYVVTPVDSLAAIAARYATTLTDLMNVNAMGTTAISAGDILAVPLPACASNFPQYSSDFGLIVPNGSYAITASHCVQCSCGPGNLNLYCMPASLAVSCSSMQCKRSNLIVGNFTAQQTSAGCSVTSCDYGGFVNGSIVTKLSSSIQPHCPGPQKMPELIAPPTTVSRDVYAPSPAPESEGMGSSSTPRTTVPSITSSIPGFGPASGPMGSSSHAPSLPAFSVASLLFFGTNFVFSVL